jgi:hypothetical protein
MFRIPSFYVDPMSFEESAKIIANRANGDLLQGMKSMDQLWEDYIALPGEEQDDDQFFRDWFYEVNAYNVVFEGMAKLFAPAAKGE